MEHVDAVCYSMEGLATVAKEWCSVGIKGVDGVLS